MSKKKEKLTHRQWLFLWQVKMGCVQCDDLNMTKGGYYRAYLGDEDVTNLYVWANRDMKMVRGDISIGAFLTEKGEKYL